MKHFDTNGVRRLAGQVLKKIAADGIMLDDVGGYFSATDVEAALQEFAIAFDAKARAWLGANQLDLTTSTWLRIELDTATYDPGANLNLGLLGNGIATGTVANHLIDAGYDFAAQTIGVGMRIQNTTDATFTYITAVAVGDLTLRDNIFVATEAWEVQATRFVAPIPGYYLVLGSIGFTSVVALRQYQIGLRINGALGGPTQIIHSALAANIVVNIANVISLAVNDYLELWAVSLAGINTVDVVGSSADTFMEAHWLSGI